MSVAEGTSDADPMAFCNYACLTTYVVERGLSDDARCHWSPDGEGAD
ncbi:MAG: hypothetical protein ACOCQL_05075 [Halolamina sp.]